MTHRDRIEANGPSTAFDIRKLDLAGSPDELPSRVLGRQIREVRLALGLTQQQLADRMSLAGTPMTHTTISKIENGLQPASLDESFVFADVLEKPWVRLVTPRPDEETTVRFTHWRRFGSVELRNWIVYGDAKSPAARAAQQGMRLAQAAYAFLKPRDEQQKSLARERLSELLGEINR